MSDDDTEQAFLQDSLKSLSLLWVLNRITADLVAHPELSPNRPMWTIVGLSSARGIGATAEELAEMRRLGEVRRQVILEHPDFRAALARLTGAGVQPVWSEDGEYGFTAVVLRLFAS